MNAHEAGTRPAAADRPAGGSSPPGPAFLFDLDGTLVDSVYQHVLAWREAMAAVGIKLAVWTIHRRIGMSGGAIGKPHPRRDRPPGSPPEGPPPPRARPG